MSIGFPGYLHMMGFAAFSSSVELTVKSIHVSYNDIANIFLCH